MSEREFIASDEDDTAAIGEEIARFLPPRGTVYFNGDLGAGKTTLIRAIATALGADRDEVSSPTFAIVHEYESAAGRLVHLDCYRLSASVREWEEIGIPEILRGEHLVFIEWPKRDFEQYENPVANVTIDILDDERRRIRFTRSGGPA